MKKTLVLISSAALLLSSAPVFADSMPAAKPAKMMVNINTTGQANLSGTLKANTASALTVTSWAGDWTINISPTTKLARQNNGKPTLSELAVGDTVSIQGKANTKGFWTIDASKVQDMSIKDGQEFSGTISNLSGSTFTLTAKNRSAIQVTLQPTASIKLNGKVSTVASLANGAMANVRGVWNSVASTLSASRVMITSKPEKKEVTIRLDAQNGSGEMGTATLKEEDGKVKVSLHLQGTPADIEQPTHIHLGSCPNPGIVKYPLSNVHKGKSETTLDVTFATLKSLLPLAINVHKSAAEASTYVACGNLTF